MAKAELDLIVEEVVALARKHDFMLVLPPELAAKTPVGRARRRAKRLEGQTSLLAKE